MKEIFDWILANEDWIRQLIIVLISIASYVYAAIVHKRSSKRLETLEAKKEAEADLMAQLAELKEALERKGVKDGESENL